MKKLRVLQPTTWLAKRLGLSLSTVERLRSQDPSELPPHVVIGNSYRYDNHVVEEWLLARMQPAPPTPVTPVIPNQEDEEACDRPLTRVTPIPKGTER